MTGQDYDQEKCNYTNQITKTLTIIITHFIFIKTFANR